MGYWESVTEGWREIWDVMIISTWQRIAVVYVQVYKASNIKYNGNENLCVSFSRLISEKSFWNFDFKKKLNRHSILLFTKSPSVDLRTFDKKRLCYHRLLTFLLISIRIVICISFVSWVARWQLQILHARQKRDKWVEHAIHLLIFEYLSCRRARLVWKLVYGICYMIVSNMLQYTEATFR